MDINKWFGSIEPSISDFESLVIACSDTGLPVIGKTDHDEALLSAVASAIVSNVKQIDPDIEYVMCRSFGEKFIIMNCNDYLIIAIGSKFTLKYLRSLVRELLQG